MEEEKKWNVKSKVTKSTTGSVGFEYSVDYHGDVFSIDDFQTALFEARKATVDEAEIIRGATQ